ncbi:MAG: NAD(P)H-dependent glycerol-3-phosphate dehydrogenase [Aquificae bacterium]|nr:NAD(P)H-dependent glycerol-3-phosphate dehydrogenase [Aquificota bacterium]
MRVFILGAGRWGTALAVHLSRLGHEPLLYDANAEVVNKINAGIHPYEEGATLKGLKATTELKDGSGAPVVVCALPVEAVRPVVSQLELRGKLFVSASKGIDPKTLKRVSETVKELHPGVDFFALSGPSFAKEVWRGLPTAVVLGYEDREKALLVQSLFNAPNFRVYLNDDLTGVELGGALKNVVAIAAGVSDGLGFGYNARSALITRGLHEMARIGVALGARYETFTGLSGMGDLVLTATADLSRNRTLGLLLGRGLPVKEALRRINQTVEGVKTAEAVYRIVKEKGIRAPVCEGVYRVLKGEPVRSVVEEILRSPPGEEFENPRSPRL